VGLNDGSLRAWALPVGPASQWPFHPALVAGIHLRWELKREHGLPWGGFYVLTRPCTVPESPGLEGQPPPEFLWDALAGVQMPLALPVVDADYPASAAIEVPQGLSPQQAAQAYGLARVTGGMKDGLASGFGDLHAVLAELVHGGPKQGPMTAREWPAKASSDGDADAPSLAAQSLLDLALLGVAFPEYAQLIGLYAIDTDANWPLTKDYLVVADCDTAFQCDPAKVVAWANAGQVHDPPPKKGPESLAIELTQVSRGNRRKPAPSG